MPKRPRHLSVEEEKLWEDVKKTTSPIHSTKSNPQKSALASPVRERSKNLPVTIEEFAISSKISPNPSTSVNLAPDVVERVRSAPLNMDRKTFRNLTRGKLRPEGRLDLHGMTLSQAQPVLTQFILAAHASGKRLVLVITGKGNTANTDEGPIPRKRGVLRDQVPRWLSSGILSGLVQQVSHAHQSHGGDGALYVYLRRRRK